MEIRQNINNLNFSSKDASSSNKAAKNFSQQNFKPNFNAVLKSDTLEISKKQISFKGESTATLFTRYFRNALFANDATKILDAHKEFGIDQYNALTSSAKNALRNYCTASKDEIHELLYLFKTMKANLAKKFPDGCTFVSIGRSPAVLAKLLQSQGADVKFCPISDMNEIGFLGAAKKYSEKYLTHLQKYGISKEAIENSTKPHVFVDYTHSGLSLKNFKTLLENSNIGLTSKNSAFLSLNDDLMKSNNPNEINKLVSKWLWECRGKFYSQIPSAGVREIVFHPESLDNYEISNDAKLMQFHLIDVLELQKTAMRPIAKKAS